MNPTPSAGRTPADEVLRNLAIVAERIDLSGPIIIFYIHDPQAAAAALDIPPLSASEGKETAYAPTFLPETVASAVPDDAAMSYFVDLCKDAMAHLTDFTWPVATVIKLCQCAAWIDAEIPRCQDDQAATALLTAARRLVVHLDAICTALSTVAELDAAVEVYR